MRAQEAAFGQPIPTRLPRRDYHERVPHAPQRTTYDQGPEPGAEP